MRGFESFLSCHLFWAFTFRSYPYLFEHTNHGPNGPRQPDGFSGNANPKLAEAVGNHLNIPLGRAKVSRFSDGEVQVELLENVRGKDVFVVQPTCQPTNDNLMELIIMVDALRRASAARITAVIPYYGYARQDRRPSFNQSCYQCKSRSKYASGCRYRPRFDNGPPR